MHEMPSTPITSALATVGSSTHHRLKSPGVKSVLFCHLYHWGHHIFPLALPLLQLLNALENLRP